MAASAVFCFQARSSAQECAHIDPSFAGTALLALGLFGYGYALLTLLWP
jgi:hypothetical protein